MVNVSFTADLFTRSMIFIIFIKHISHAMDTVTFFSRLSALPSVVCSFD